MGWGTSRPPQREPGSAPPPDTTPPGQPARLTLAAVVGGAVAMALGVAIPREESGRVAETELDAQGALVSRHVNGPLYLVTYLDMVGVPTICDGLTRINGQRVPRDLQLTEEQCAHYLEIELIAHAQGVMACTPGLALSDDPLAEAARQGPRFAAVSLAYNVGVGGYCGSTAARRFNAGNLHGGCEALTWWNKAGGRVVRGLVARRQREFAVCVGGLPT